MFDAINSATGEGVSVFDVFKKLSYVQAGYAEWVVEPIKKKKQKAPEDDIAKEVQKKKNDFYEPLTKIKYLIKDINGTFKIGHDDPSLVNKVQKLFLDNGVHYEKVTDKILEVVGESYDKLQTNKEEIMIPFMREFKLIKKEVSKKISETTSQYIQEIKIGESTYLANTKKEGLHLFKKTFIRDTKSFKDVFVKRISTYHIVKVKKYLNPYGATDVYKISFVNDKSRKIAVKGTLDQMVEKLKNMVGFMDHARLKEYLSIYLSSVQEILFEQYNPLGDGWGFYKDEEKLIKSKDIFSESELDPDVDESKLKEGLEALKEIIYTYSEGKPPEYRKELLRLATLSLLKPFGYVRKQSGLIVPIVIIVGASGTGKTISTIIEQGIWGVFNHRDADHGASSVASAYQMANKCNMNTFPLGIQEAGVILKSLETTDRLTELFKNMTETPYAVYDNKAGTFFSLRIPTLTANYGFRPSGDAIRLRILPFHFNQEYAHKGNERASMTRMIAENAKKLSYIGSWIALKVLKGDKEYVKPIYSQEYSQGCVQMFKGILKESKFNMLVPTPKVAGLFENDDENVSFWEDMISTIRKDLITEYRNTRSGDESRNKSITLDTAFESLASANNLPPYLVFMSRKGFVMVGASVVNAVVRETKRNYEFATLEKECFNREYEYCRKKSFRINGKSSCKSGWTASLPDFINELKQVHEDIAIVKIENNNPKILTDEVMDYMIQSGADIKQNMIDEYDNKEEANEIIKNRLEKGIIYEKSAGIYVAYNKTSEEII